MNSCHSQLNRIHIVIFSLLILLCVSATPNPRWSKASAAMQLCPPATMTPPSLVDGTVGTSYSQNLNVTGGSLVYSFAIVANSLPPGLTLSAANGLISGTPTTTGTYSFLVRATAQNGCTVTRAYTITIDCGTLTLDPATLPSVVIGTSYSQTIRATVGKGTLRILDHVRQSTARSVAGCKYGKNHWNSRTRKWWHVVLRCDCHRCQRLHWLEALFNRSDLPGNHS